MGNRHGQELTVDLLSTITFGRARNGIAILTTVLERQAKFTQLEPNRSVKETLLPSSRMDLTHITETLTSPSTLVKITKRSISCRIATLLIVRRLITRTLGQGLRQEELTHRSLTARKCTRGNTITPEKFSPFLTWLTLLVKIKMETHGQE